MIETSYFLGIALSYLLGIESSLSAEKISSVNRRKKLKKEVASKLQTLLTKENFDEATQLILTTAMENMPLFPQHEGASNFVKEIIENGKMRYSFYICIKDAYSEESYQARCFIINTLRQVLDKEDVPIEQQDEIAYSFANTFDDVITFNDDLRRIRTSSFEKRTTDSLRELKNIIVNLDGVPMSSQYFHVYDNFVFSNSDMKWNNGESEVLNDILLKYKDVHKGITVIINTKFRSPFYYTIPKEGGAFGLLVLLLYSFGVLDENNNYQYALLKDTEGHSIDYAYLSLRSSLDENGIKDNDHIYIGYLKPGNKLFQME